MSENVLPEDSQERKDLPMATGLLDYFPAALAYVAKISKIGNDKHNPGEPLHHARGKSMDHADTIVRHLVDRGGFDDQGVRHSGYAAWRALALLQQELEDAGESPLARGATFPEDEGEVLTLPTSNYVRRVHCLPPEQRVRVIAVRAPRVGELYVGSGGGRPIIAECIVGQLSRPRKIVEPVR